MTARPARRAGQARPDPKVIVDPAAAAVHPGPACPADYHIEIISVHQRQPVDQDLEVAVCASTREWTRPSTR